MSYGLPPGTAIDYGAPWPDPWVDELCRQWNLDSSTYPGHQESDRPDIGAAPNPQRLNRGIDWAGPPEKMLAFARWLVSIGPDRTSGQYGPPGLEMLIYEHAPTGERVWYPSWVNYDADFSGHRDHVHTRQSASLIDVAAPPLSKADQYALAVIEEGRKRSISRKGICIALTVPFVESGWQMYANSNVPESLNYPHDAVGSDHDSTGLFQQRQAWGPLSCTMDAACSAGLFFDGGQAGQRGLIAFDYNSDTRTPGGWAQAVQVSAYPDRYDEHWDEANRLYDRLAGAAPPEEGDSMAQVPQEQWDRVYRELTQLLPSRSPLRHLDEGVIDTMAGMAIRADAEGHVQLVRLLASLGHPESLALLGEVAGADPAKYPDRQRDALVAQAILADLQNTPQPTPTPTPTPTPVPTPTPMPSPAPQPPGSQRPVLYCVNGFMSDLWVGPPADVGHALENAFYFQPVGFNSTAFPLGIGRDSGVVELKRLIREHQSHDPGRRFAFFGFSLGAVIVDDVFDALRSGDMQQFWPYFLGGAKIGDPRRERGVWSGGPNDPGGQGIAGTGNLKQTPTANFRSYMYDQNRGDIYANAGINPLTGRFDQGIADDMQTCYDFVMLNWQGGLGGLMAEFTELITKLGPAAIDIIMSIYNGIGFAANQNPHMQYPLDDAEVFLRGLLV